MSKHTPGPWTFEESFDGDTSEGLYIKADGECIASLSGNGYADYANAALMAAAPELLAALQALLPAYRKAVGLYDSNHDDAFTVRAHNAIAKATGGNYDSRK